MVGKFGGSIRQRGPNTYQLRICAGSAVMPDGMRRYRYIYETMRGSKHEALRRLDEIKAGR
ncbi:MAG: hypothetical protein VB144_15195 [Clostridia bacterium]|nr:hypothetical protein [Clostridia bacterium]